MSRAPPAATPPPPLELQPPAEPPPAVKQLVSNHKPATPNGQCSTQAAALVVAGGRLLGSAGAMVVMTPTVIGEVPVILNFIGASVTFAATAAMYLSCKDEAAARAAPP